MIDGVSKIKDDLQPMDDDFDMMEDDLVMMEDGQNFLLINQGHQNLFKCSEMIGNYKGKMWLVGWMMTYRLQKMTFRLRKMSQI